MMKKPLARTLLKLAAVSFLSCVILSPTTIQAQPSPQMSETAAVPTTSLPPTVSPDGMMTTMKMQTYQTNMPTAMGMAIPTGRETTMPTTMEMTTSKMPETTTMMGTSMQPKPTIRQQRAAGISEGYFDSSCNTTEDCQINMNLQCLDKICTCELPQIFDIPQQRCLTPLGKECVVDSEGNSPCPEFAECFLNRCVCKTGYSLYTMTRCKLNSNPIQMWPRLPKASVDDEETDSSEERGDEEKVICTPDSCDESKGLFCQEDGACKCKEPDNVFVDEFNRCLNEPMQKNLKEALSLVQNKDLDLKSLVKLLQRYDETSTGDQETGASNNYDASPSPIAQLISLLGNRGGDKGKDGETKFNPLMLLSRLGDLYSSAIKAGDETKNVVKKENVAPITDSVKEDESSKNAVPLTIVAPNSKGSASSTSQVHSPPGGIEFLSDSRESGEFLSKAEPEHKYQPINIDGAGYRPLSTSSYHPSRQGYFGNNVVPAASNHFNGLHGLGAHHGLGHHGFGGHGGYHGLGGHGLGHHHGIGHHGGYGGGFGGHHGGIGHHGLGHGGFGGHGHGLGQHHGHHGHGLGHHHGIGHHGGHHGGHHHHHPSPIIHKEEPKKGLLTDLTDFLGKSFKLIHKFMPVIHIINDVIKKGRAGHGHFDKKDPGEFKVLYGADGDDHDGFEKRYGLASDSSTEQHELFDEGGILSGFSKFVGTVMRIKERVDAAPDDDPLKKILT